MKKLALLLIAITLSFSTQAQVETPQPSPFSKQTQTVGLTEISLEYSRPSMHERKIFGGLVPYDKLWRTGANANTKITFSDDVVIGDKTLKAGTYALFAKPNAKTWEIIFYTDSDNWGTPRSWDDAKVAAMVTAQVQKIPLKIETFTMLFDDLTNNSTVLGMLWEDVYVGVKITVPTETKVKASMDKTFAGATAGDYFSAARYYLQEEKDIKQAKTWIDKAIEMTKDKPRFWYLRQQSLIYAKAGDKKGAIKAAKASLEGAKKAGNDNYVKMNEASLKEWGAM